MMFYDVTMNRSVSTEDSRGLTSYKDTQPSSPHQALAIASQANDFESQLRDSRPEVEIAAPVEASEAATVASTAPNEEEDNGFDTRFADNFDGIDWSRLKGYIRPPRTYTQRKS
jgi:hypothetical protein